MRFATWNLWAKDTVGKLARLDPAPDVAVLCEVRQEQPPSFGSLAGTRWLWDGTLADRGIAVASWTSGLEPVPPVEGRAGGRHSVAADLENGLGVLGIWSCPPREKGRSYAAEIHAAIDAYESFLTSRPCIIAGDFNVSPGGHYDRRYGVSARLGELGYASVYHAAHSLDPGHELHHTYWHQFRRDQPFHIDLVYVPVTQLHAVESVHVAPYEGWVDGPAGVRSDHVPVTVEINLPQFLSASV